MTRTCFYRKRRSCDAWPSRPGLRRIPSLDPGSDSPPVARIGHAHRGLEAAEVDVEVVPFIADQHELARLIGGDQKRWAELPQERGEVRRVDCPQRRRVVRLGGVGPERRFGGGKQVLSWLLTPHVRRSELLGPRRGCGNRD